MLHTPPNEEWIVSTLRDVETPDPAPSLFSFPRRKRQTWKWIAPAGIVTAGAALALVLTLQPSATLAQVAAAQTNVQRYTIINTRILNNGQTFKVLTYRDGAKWAIYYTNQTDNTFLRTVTDGKRTVTITNYPNWHILDAIFDDLQPLATHDFEVKHMMREGKPFTTKRVVRDGQVVDKFESLSTYQGIKGPETFDQTILANAKTHLPIRLEVFRNNRAWGDIWDFRYDPILESVFNSEPPSGFKVYDLRVERLALAQALKNGPVITIGHQPDVGILIPYEGTTVRSKVHIDGMGEGFQKNWQFIPKPMQIAGKPWRLVRVILYPTDLEKLGSIKGLATTSIEVDGKRIENVPIMQVGNTGSLLHPFWPKELR